MLWERKTQILKETREVVDSQIGKEEMKMKAEIHRMEVNTVSSVCQIIVKLLHNFVDISCSQQVVTKLLKYLEKVGREIFSCFLSIFMQLSSVASEAELQKKQTVKCYSYRLKKHQF